MGVREKDITSTLPPELSWRGDTTVVDKYKLWGRDGVRLVGVKADGTREELKMVFWCNLATKRVWRNKPDAKGQPYFDPKTDDVAWEEVTYADVRVLRKV